MIQNMIENYGNWETCRIEHPSILVHKAQPTNWQCDSILLYQCCHTILAFLDAFGQVTPRFANICRSAGSLAVMASNAWTHQNTSSWKVGLKTQPRVQNWAGRSILGNHSCRVSGFCPGKVSMPCCQCGATMGNLMLHGASHGVNASQFQSKR